MSAALLSAFYDLDFLRRRTEKSLASLSLGTGAPDAKAVGAPLARRLEPEVRGRDRARSDGDGSGSLAELRPQLQLHLQPLQPQPQPLPLPRGPSARYKTELCRPFAESGACKYGDKCQFAHGGHELRSLARHPKYKTELCRTFHSSGFCPYGPRCHFVHNADERRPAPPARPRLQHSLSFAGFPSRSPPCAPSCRSPEPPGAVFAPGPERRDLRALAAPPSPPDSRSDRHSRPRSGSLSPGSSSLSGSDSPGPDPARRLPIFSRLSVSDD
ncbi:mRNA decay activator protein ZFP36L2 [Suncus etruscus]|uniref:mRNA decay activator protein ZFP36L2 n=1 Tax=Suncus etruscus TaxID=109475 RepID=UPI002110C776|nr:mRNA decay activator protein ZFP36L2 [Suncus etruscus]